MTHVCNLVFLIARSLASYPEKVKVKEIGYGRVRIIYLYCDKEDVGLIVGRFGQCAKAMRVISYNLGAKMGLRYRVEIEGR